MNRGFSLIELLVILLIISALSLLSISSYQRAKQVAAFSVSQATARQIKTALSLGIVQVTERGEVADVNEVISSQTQIQSSPILRDLLWGFMLPNRVTVVLQVDTLCNNETCPVAGIVIDHQNACKLLQTTQYGNGNEITVVIPKNTAGC